MSNDLTTFSLAVKKVVLSWDVLKRAVDESWGDYDAQRCAERLVEDLIVNFDEARQKKKKLHLNQLDEFLRETMDEFFSADIEDTGKALARILEVLYSELLEGSNDTAQKILA